MTRLFTSLETQYTGCSAGFSLFTPVNATAQPAKSDSCLIAFAGVNRQKPALQPLFILLFCLLSLHCFGQRRVVVREPQREQVYFYPKVTLQGRGMYIPLESDYQKTYTSWANLAERSSQINKPIVLQLSLDSVIQQSDWASLRQVAHVQSLNMALPPQVTQATLDSLLNALANWPELTYVSFGSPRMDLTKPQPNVPVLTVRPQAELKSVRSASVSGLGNWLKTSLYLLRQCPALNKLTINSFANGEALNQLPPELAQLTPLRTLQLSSGIGFSGLDRAFSGLTNLTSLYLTNTGDGQLLTKALSHLPNLRKLELRFGITDSDLSQLRLGNLSQLDTLECHFITGTRFPVDSVLAGLPALKSITLANSQLPALNWLADHPHLRAMRLTGCRFPPSTRSLAKLTQLETISIEQADSLGAFPEAFSTLPNLRDLSIPDAQINALPPSIGTMQSLTALNLYHNNLRQLPAELGNLRALKILNLGTNQLANLPTSLCQLPILESLALYENQLTSLPAGLGQLRQLRNLSLSNNQLTTLPDELMQCRKLESLVLDHNPLTTLPNTLGTLDSLCMLYLDNTRLRVLPFSIGSLKKLHTLDLSGGHLVFLPAALGDCQSLTSLSIEDSTLTALPGSLAKLTHLAYLSLGLPQVRVLPNELMQLTELEKLTLFMPRLALLPDNLGDLRQLTSLRLWCDKLLGLPNSVGRLSQLTELAVLGNSDTVLMSVLGVVEQLPDSIVYCQKLEKLTVKYQQAFDGADAIRKLANIANLRTVNLDRCGISDLTNIDWKTVQFSILTLQENNIHQVPEAILDMPNLRTLNLQENALLPPSLSQTFWSKETLRKALVEAGK